MPDEIKDQFMGALSSINERKRQLLTKGKEFESKGDVENANKAKEYLRGLKEQEAVMQQQYLDEAVTRKNSILEGIASGETIKDYQKTIKSYIPVSPSASMGSYNPNSLIEEKIYKFNPDKLKKELSKIGYDNVDIETGVGALDTTFLAGLRNDESRKEYFQREGKGYELIETLNIDGKQNFLVKNKEGKTILALPKGINVKDVGAFVASEALPTVGGIIGGLTGAGAGAPTGPGAIVTAAAGSAAGYSGVGAAQDMALRIALGLDIKPKEVLVDRSKEMALGFVTGYGASKLLQPLAKRAGNPIENLVAQDLADAESLLRKSGKTPKLDDIENVIPVAASGGSSGVFFQRGLAGRFPSMEVAKKMQAVRNVMGEYQQVIQNQGQNLPPVDFTRVVAKRDALARQISKRDDNIRAESAKILDSRLGLVKAPEVNKVEFGKVLLGLIDDAAAKGKEINEATYNAFFARPNVASVSVPKAQVLGQIQRKLNDPINRGLKSPEVESLLKDYAEVFPDNLTMRDIDNIRKGISGATSRTQSSTTSQQVASGVAEEVGNIFETTLAKYNLTADWANTMKTFDETRLAFRRSSPGSILMDKFGAKVKSPEEMVEAALSSTQAVKDVIGALKNTGDDAGANVVREQLKNVYKEKIGITPNGTFNGINSKHTPEMVEAIWDNPLVAKRINSQIAELNDVLKIAKVDKVNLTPEDANRLLDTIPLNERKALLKEIEKKAIQQNRNERFVDNEIIKLAKNGQFSNIDGDLLAQTALYKATPQELDDIMGMLTLSGKQKLGADMFSKLLADNATSGQNQLVSGANAGFDLWDAGKVNRSLAGFSRKDGRNAPQWLKSMDKVVGRDTMDEFIAASKVLEANTPLTKLESDSLGLNALYSLQGIKFYGSNLLGYSKNKTLAAAYGSNNLRPLMRYMSRNIGDEKYAENVNKMMRGVVMTRPGIQALIAQSKDDPQFSREVGLMYAEMQADLDKEKQAQQR